MRDQGRSESLKDRVRLWTEEQMFRDGATSEDLGTCEEGNRLIKVEST